MSSSRRRARIGLVTGIVLGTLAAAAIAQPDARPPVSKLHAALIDRLVTEPGPAHAWVFFTDKALHTRAQLDAALDDVQRTYNPRALWRRAVRGDNAARGGRLVDEHDIPVPQGYLDAVLASGAELRRVSRWLNACSVALTREQAEQVAALPFVARVEPVSRSWRKTQVLDAVDHEPVTPVGEDERTLNYGVSQAQLAQINLIALHDAGYTGQGVIIGILDTGFRRDHVAFNNPAKPLVVLAEWDFINNDNNTGIQPGDPPGQHTHGTYILGCIAAYAPGTVVGGAFDAQFILCKTEDTTQEVPAEEDDYVAGLEFTEFHGADMTTASLGYIDWYTQAQLNGQTAVCTIAMNIHTANGVHHTNAAGNESNDSNPATSHLIAPADAFQCLTIGAVNSSGNIASFSSDGPTADGRVKPELLARGVTTYTVSPSNTTGTTTADGTSLSTPLAAAAVACLVQARPWWTVDQMRAHLFTTASYYVANGTYDPLYVRGYGIINAFAAYNTCDRAGVVQLDRSKYACSATSATITVVDCDLDTNHQLIETIQIVVTSTSEPGGELVTLTELGPDAGAFAGSVPLSLTDAPGVVRIAAGDVLTATYIDADNGQGGYNIVVTDTAPIDCTPPGIGNVQATNIQPRSATVTFTSNEPVRGKVWYGLSCNGPLATAESATYSTTPSIALSNLQDGADYFFKVEATDEAGNVALSDNGGQCYAFSTPDVPDYYTELFVSGNDLDFLALEFHPGDVVPYFGCAYPITQLPTDPAGGTSLGFTSDDEFKTINLPGGLQVVLYGVGYSTIHVGANGYLTFTAGDTTYTESLAAHFNRPRISGLFDDLSPQLAGASVSYKILSDRIAITFLNVPEFNASGSSNTFQFELYFTGLIRISYLSLSASDGLAGLSRGLGVPADFYMSDLSALPACGPRPPMATSQQLQTAVGQSLLVTLSAEDDGLPDPPGALSYVITSLPQRTLRDAVTNHRILPAELPYTLAGNTVLYQPGPTYQGIDAFTFRARDGGTPPEGGDSNTATVTITVGGPVPIYVFDLNTNPGWSTTGQWAFGQPTGQGGSAHGYPDPASGFTGTNVYGVNLGGDYSTAVGGPFYLTTAPLDLSQAGNTKLRFRRWLNTDYPPYVSSRVEISTNGTNWSTVWAHLSSPDIRENAWSLQQYDISAQADYQPAVRIRWSYQVGSSAWAYSGWNLDDIEIWGLVPVAPAPCPGDVDCDGEVTFDDIDYFVEALGYPGGAGWPYATCPWLSADTNGDQNVTFDDIDPFVALIGTSCP